MRVTMTIAAKTASILRSIILLNWYIWDEKKIINIFSLQNLFNYKYV
jgi:hypothetical protein